MSFYLILLILLACFILFLFWLFDESPTDLKVKHLKIPKRMFVLVVLDWCNQNIGTNNHPYQLKIHYYQNKKIMGRFMSWNKEIVIYLFPDLYLIDVVDTVIHEYIHHLQFLKRTTEKDYDKKLTEIGYWNNPYEVEARKQAKRYRNECLEWIFSNYMPC